MRILLRRKRRAVVPPHPAIVGLTSLPPPVQLAPEIMVLIAEFTDPASRPNLALVNKAWASVTIPAMYVTANSRRLPPFALFAKYHRFVRALQFLPDECPTHDRNLLLFEATIDIYGEHWLANVRTLSYSDSCFLQDDIFRLLGMLSGLRSLALTETSAFTDELQVRRLYHAISDLQQLESLTLDVPSAGKQVDKALDGVADVKIRPLPNLKDVRLFQSRSNFSRHPNVLMSLDHVVWQQLHLAYQTECLALQLIPDTLPNLRTLALEDFSIPDKKISSLLAHNSHELQELSLVNTGISTQALDAISPFMRKLHRFRLLPEGPPEPIRRIILLSAEYLHHLSVPGDCWDSYCGSIIKACPELRSLEVGQGQDSTVAQLASNTALQARCRDLVQLTVFQRVNRITCEKFVKAWAFDGLAELSLKLVWVGATMRGESEGGCMYTIFSMLSSLIGLRVLEVCNFGAHHIQESVSKKALETLSDMTYLRRLRVSKLAEWRYATLLWFLEAFDRQLSEFEYSTADMSPAVHSWLQLNQPTFRLIPRKC
ncbi:hypothetical protein BG004_004983 [Podila humilis]|nr:hypothetical protein BG004_004983 [Podila humilis]